MTLTLPTEKHIQSVAHSPRSDGKQPGSGRTSSSVPVQAAPHSTWRDVLDAYEADVKTLPLGHEMPTRGCSTYNWKMSVLNEIRQRFEASAPIPIPQASSPLAAGNSASSVSDVPPLSFDPAFLAAWRESQGQPVDAEAR